MDPDPIQAALAEAIRVIASRMASAPPTDLASLAENMAGLTRQLDARREERTGIVSLAARRARR